MRRLSPSALDRYRTCPRRFFYQDVERRHPKEPPSPILAQANAIHHALERWHGLERCDRTPETIERAMRSVWPRHRSRETFASRDEEREAGLRSLEMLVRYAGSAEADAEVIAREQWLSCRLGNGVEVFGKVDRLGHYAGGIEVVDYKTGLRELEPDDLRLDSAAQVYALAASCRLERPVDRVRFIYLVSGRSVCWEPEPDDLDAVAERLEKLTEEIRGDELFEANPGDHCRFCPFALDCVARQHVELASIVPVEGLPF